MNVKDLLKDSIIKDMLGFLAKCIMAILLIVAIGRCEYERVAQKEIENEKIFAELIKNKEYVQCGDTKWKLITSKKLDTDPKRNFLYGDSYRDRLNADDVKLTCVMMTIMTKERSK